MKGLISRGTSVWSCIQCSADSLPAVPSSPPVLTFKPRGVPVSTFSKWSSIFMTFRIFGCLEGIKANCTSFNLKKKPGAHSQFKGVWNGWGIRQRERLRSYFSLWGKGWGSTASPPSSPCSASLQSGAWFLTRSSESSHGGVRRLSSISPDN